MIKDGPTWEFGIDTESAKRTINDLMRFAEESVGRLGGDASFDKKSLDLESKRLKNAQQMLRIAQDTLKAEEVGARLMEKKLAINERIRREQDMSLAYIAMTPGSGAGGGRVGRGGGSISGGGMSGEQRLMAVAQVVEAGAWAVQNASFKGFVGSSVLGGIGETLGAAGPLGKLLGAPFNIMAQNWKAEEDRQTLRALLFRTAGERGRQTFLNALGAPNEPGFLEKTMGAMGIVKPVPSFYEWMGLFPEDLARLIGGSEKAGISSAQSLNVLAALEGKFGAGEAGVGLLGAARRAGLGGAGGARDMEAVKLLGDAIGLQLSTGLERARVPEIFANLTRVLGALSTGFVSPGNIVGMQNLIGQIGPAFQGNTPAAQATGNLLETLAKGGGGTGLAYIQGLQDLSKRYPSADFFELQGRLAQGIAGGGRTAEAVVAAAASLPNVQAAWRSGDDGAKRSAAQVAAALYGLSPDEGNRLYFLLESHFRGGRVPVPGGVWRRLGEGLFEVPEEDLDVLQRAAIGGRRYRGGGRRVQDVFEQGLSHATAPPAPPPPGGGAGAPGGFVHPSSVHWGQWGASRELIRHGAYVRGTMGQRKHFKLDSTNLPPGTVVEPPWPFTVTGINAHPMIDASYGGFVSIRTDDGFTHSFMHIDPNPALRVGGRYPAGTPVGTIVSKPMGPRHTAPHLDYGIKNAHGVPQRPDQYPGVGPGMFLVPSAASGSASHASSGFTLHVVVSDNRTTAHVTRGLSKMIGQVFSFGLG